jgi:hypothetical protein
MWLFHCDKLVPVVFYAPKCQRYILNDPVIFFLRRGWWFFASFYIYTWGTFLSLVGPRGRHAGVAWWIYSRALKFVRWSSSKNSAPYHQSETLLDGEMPIWRLRETYRPIYSSVSLRLLTVGIFDLVVWWFVNMPFLLYGCDILISYPPPLGSRYSDWLWAGRPSGRSSRSGRVNTFLFSKPLRLALGSTQPPMQ